MSTWPNWEYWIGWWELSRASGSTRVQEVSRHGKSGGPPLFSCCSLFAACSEQTEAVPSRPSLAGPVETAKIQFRNQNDSLENLLLLLLLSRFSRVRLCVTPETAAHQDPPSLGFSRQEHWSGLPFPSPMHESKSEVAQSCLTLSDTMDCSLTGSSIHGIFQARVLEWGCHCLLRL